MLEFNIYPGRVLRDSVGADLYLFLGPFDIKDLTNADNVQQQLQHQSQICNIREPFSSYYQSIETGDLSEIELQDMTHKETGSCNRGSIGYRKTTGAPMECKAGHIPMEVYEWREKIIISCMISERTKVSKTDN